MRRFEYILCLAATILIPCATASPWDWSGSFTNSIFTEPLHVCVSEGLHNYVGQGVLSNVAYFNGTVFLNDSWIGNYWFAGGGRLGSFNLRLIGGGSSLATYKGDLLEHPLGRFVHDIAGYQISPEAPEDSLCFRTDVRSVAKSPTFIVSAHTNMEYNSFWTIMSPNKSREINLHTIVERGRFRAFYNKMVVDSRGMRNGTAVGTLQGINNTIALFHWTEAFNIDAEDSYQSECNNTISVVEGIGLAVLRTEASRSMYWLQLNASSVLKVSGGMLDITEGSGFSNSSIVDNGSSSTAYEIDVMQQTQPSHSFPSRMVEEYGCYSLSVVSSICHCARCRADATSAKQSFSDQVGSSEYAKLTPEEVTILVLALCLTAAILLSCFFGCWPTKKLNTTPDAASAPSPKRYHRQPSDWNQYFWSLYVQDTQATVEQHASRTVRSQLEQITNLEAGAPELERDQQSPSRGYEASGWNSAGINVSSFHEESPMH